MMNWGKWGAAFLVSAMMIIPSSLVAATAGAPLAVAEGLQSLVFNPADYAVKTVTVDGQTISYRAYEKRVYVSHPVDANSQYLNVYVPESAVNSQTVPILFPNRISGYFAAQPVVPAAHASLKYVVNKADPVPVTLGKGPANLASVALAKGYVVVSPGARGSNSMVNGQYTGKAPAAVVDLKAAVRYLRLNDAAMAGSAEKIISDGTSAGGAISAALGASGNDARYAPYLAALGAADQKDHVFATICFAPITDLDHADMAYEWMYQRVNDKTAAGGKSLYGFSDEQKALSAKLKALYPAYFNGLGLKSVYDGSPLQETALENYLKTFLIASAQKALDRGIDVSTTPWLTVRNKKVVDVDFNAYVSSVGRQKMMKDPPAFDWLGDKATKPPRNAGSRENKLFGTAAKDISIFTDFAAEQLGATLPREVKERVQLMNAMHFIGKSGTEKAPNWYIRHGSIDGGTALSVPVNLYTKLKNAGMNVDFGIAWGMPHAGDYDLEELFAWIDQISGSR